MNDKKMNDYHSYTSTTVYNTKNEFSENVFLKRIH